MGAPVSKTETTLSQALAAYAGATSGQALDADLVRSRVLHSVRAPQRLSLRRYSFALPLVATLAASAAFAASQPSVHAVVAARWETWFGAAPPAPKQRPLARHTKPALAPVAGALESHTDASGVGGAPIAVDQLPLALPAPSADEADPHATGVVNPPAGSALSEADPQLEAYRAAHRTHFDGGNPGAAVAAWDRYLADFPAGSFATDARFNRALCLVRLGRQTEARAALLPFANAAPGSYRQAEASALLQGLAGPTSRASK
jgi:hypothetical protein